LGAKVPGLEVMVAMVLEAKFGLALLFQVCSQAHLIRKEENVAN
jgi:hypothetical protein